MKKTLLSLLLLIFLTSIGNHSSLAENTDISQVSNTGIFGKWINVRDGDFYVFNSDGTGTHQDTSTIYSIEQNTISVFVGALALTPNVFTLDNQTGIDRLIAEDKSTFYVREEDYPALSEQIRKESISTLTSSQFWTAINVSATNYITFSPSGRGWFLLPGTSLPLTWEMIDNDTVKLLVDFNGGQSITLNIVNNQGSVQLVNAQTGVVTYVPKK